jgi:hypothetical protein
MFCNHHGTCGGRLASGVCERSCLDLEAWWSVEDLKMLQSHISRVTNISCSLSLTDALFSSGLVPTDAMAIDDNAIFE